MPTSPRKPCKADHHIHQLESRYLAPPEGGVLEYIGSGPPEGGFSPVASNGEGWPNCSFGELSLREYFIQ